VKSNYLLQSGRDSEAVAVADAGLAVNPNCARLLQQRGNAETSLDFEQAKSDIRQAMRLSPRDPKMGSWIFNIGGVEIEQGHYDAAIDEIHKSIEAGFRSYIPYAVLAASYALKGKMDEAKAALAEARRLNPNLTVKWFIAHSPPVPKAIEGIRKAGLPEE
jgi:adenylate cyclase